MARYRHKDETDLRWNRIRRRITIELDAQIKNWREEALNKLLSEAWERYVAALDSGEKLELESHYQDFARKALTGTTGVNLEEITK